jgi:catechol 2,3-dioxygenase-like lactoylglutathione lyase family enzyme
MSNPTGIFETGHVGLNVNDLKRSKEFYSEVFGFEVRGESTAEDRKYAMLAQGGKLVLTLWAAKLGGIQPADCRTSSSFVSGEIGRTGQRNRGEITRARHEADL